LVSNCTGPKMHSIIHIDIIRFFSQCDISRQKLDSLFNEQVEKDWKRLLYKLWLGRSLNCATRLNISRTFSSILSLWKQSQTYVHFAQYFWNHRSFSSSDRWIKILIIIIMVQYKKKKEKSPRDANNVLIYSLIFLSYSLVRFCFNDCVVDVRERRVLIKFNNPTSCAREILEIREPFLYSPSHRRRSRTHPRFRFPDVYPPSL